MPDCQNIQEKLLNYCQENGIEVIFKPVRDGFILDLCQIERGGRFIISPNANWSDKITVSLILHELGHLLSVPIEQRPLLNSKLKGVNKKYICEYAARLVAYNLCIKLEIPLKYCIAFFASEPDVMDRNHTIESFYMQAYSWYWRDKIELKKEAVIEC